MPEEKKPYVGDIGTIILVNVIRPDDPTGTIEDASVIELRVIKPDESEDTWVAAIHTTNKDIIYTIVSGDFDQEGIYKINAYIVSPFWTGLGETFLFRVYAKGE